MKIKDLDAWEVLDSRGRPTIAVKLTLEKGAVGLVSVPAGASTGRSESKELRDGEERFGGFGCRRAAENVRQTIGAAVLQESFSDQGALDRCLIALDGSPDRARLGANSLLGVSLAFARACAVQEGVQLFNYFGSLLPKAVPRLPALTINLFSGGKHGHGQVAIQDVLVVPDPDLTISDQLAQMYAIYQQAAKLTVTRYEARPLKADEGGLAPPFESSAAMLAAAAEVVEGAGFKIGQQVSLALDVAASHFQTAEGEYCLDGELLSPVELIQTLREWAEQYPLVSIEDGLGEEDWERWPDLLALIGNRSLIVADDLTCTNPVRIQRAIKAEAANALLLKVNQIGTLTEAKEAYLLARTAGWQVSVSARSGETEDTWLADLAVGWAADFLKVGSITRSERLAKYNRLLEIEHEWLRAGEI
jgi:enolase